MLECPVGLHLIIGDRSFQAIETMPFVLGELDLGRPVQCSMFCTVPDGLSGIDVSRGSSCAANEQVEYGMHSCAERQ
jgi:hypothetical protein